MEAPDDPCDEASPGETPAIDRIGDAVMHHHRAKPLEKNDPDRDMQGNLPPAGRFVIGAKTDQAVSEEKDRQRHGYGQSVVKMTMKKRRVMVQVWLDHHAVDDINREANEK